jgi:uncharacterized protein (TIGR00730 family)
MNIGFFSSSKEIVKNKYCNKIVELLNKIKKLKNVKNAVYGGGNIGVMGLVHSVFKDNIISHNLEKWQISSSEHIHPNIITRQKAIIDDSDLFIVLPGGVGTVSELFDCIMLNDTDEFKKPIIIYNCDNYYSDLYKFINKLYEDGASTKSDLLFISDDIDIIINIINNYSL